MSKHTPGPWVAPKEQGNLVLPKVNWESQQLGAIKDGMQILVYPCGTKETEANLALIASAPELLKLLKDAAIHLQVASSYAPDQSVDDVNRVTGERLKTIGHRTVLLSLAALIDATIRKAEGG